VDIPWPALSDAARAFLLIVVRDAAAAAPGATGPCDAAWIPLMPSVDRRALAAAADDELDGAVALLLDDAPALGLGPDAAVIAPARAGDPPLGGRAPPPPGRSTGFHGAEIPEAESAAAGLVPSDPIRSESGETTRRPLDCGFVAESTLALAPPEAGPVFMAPAMSERWSPTPRAWDQVSPRALTGFPVATELSLKGEF
jgi:hypothetical protein